MILTPKRLNNFRVIGLMSGTSLDGLDIAYCHFSKTKKGWRYKLIKSTTVKYSAVWSKKLSAAQQLSGEALTALDVAYGKFVGQACAKFIAQNNLEVDFIASHGHTIFHQPRSGFTLQLGNGTAIHATTSLPVVNDFRSLDVMLGGEGAPLVPVGDKFLFTDYDICLNLGGIANLSLDVKNKRVAYDVCFCNMSLNFLMEKKGERYDKNGYRASIGNINKPMLQQLNKVYSTFRKKRPSLGREIFEQSIRPLLDNPEISLEDKLRTCVESSAKEIANAIAVKKNAHVLCTGGGAFNSFFMTSLLEHCEGDVVLIIPDEEVVKFKEALVFAFLGVLRIHNRINCLQSVTGASRNSSGGNLIGF